MYDKIDYGLLGRALAGVPAAQAAQVREACAGWTRLRLAAIATMWTIADPPAPHVADAVYTGVTKEGSPDPGLRDSRARRPSRLSFDS